MHENGSLCAEIATILTVLFSAFAGAMQFFNSNAAGIGAICAIISCTASIHQRYFKKILGDLGK